MCYIRSAKSCGFFVVQAILLWTGCFAVSASFSMVVPFLPIFLLDIGLTENIEFWSVLLFSSAFLAGAISAPFWGAMGDKYGRKPLILRAGFVLCAIYLLTAFVTNQYELLLPVPVFSACWRLC